MKQVVQNYRTGEVSLKDVPPPQVQRGGVLVQNACSLISPGTERAMIALARKNLLQKARARPDLVRKVLDKARTEGVLTAYRKATQRLESPMPLGYSSAGTVIAVGEEVDDLEVGDAVACGGVGYACHAEVVFVPRNLCVKVPAVDGGQHSNFLPFDQAAYSTLGAIGLEGVRVADAKIGEGVVVIGLGLVGLLVVQILKAAGCKVVGLDINAERCQLGLELGADAVAADQASAAGMVDSVFGVPGADAVIITAATASSEPVRVAGELSRDRGRVVVVGIVGLEVPHKLYYEKALELRLSRSYGPGRYDRFYEEKGLRYPVGYVRWTENRNMEAFLQLVASGKVNVSTLSTHRFPISRALDAYRLITEGSEPHIGVLLTYPRAREGTDAAACVSGGVSWRDTASCAASSDGARWHGNDQRRPLGLGVIGAGNFATGVLLPALREIEGVELRGICSERGLSARAAAEKFGFVSCASSPSELLDDPLIGALLILTRPASHAELVSAALAAGKHVFVEKPLAVNQDQLAEVLRSYERARLDRGEVHSTRRQGASRKGDFTADTAFPSRPILSVGFNRRYSPFARHLKEFFGGRRRPLAAVYRVNANYLPKDDWQHDPEQGGGRLVGEVGHFIDLLGYITGGQPRNVSAHAVGASGGDLLRFENVAISICFSDGSLATILYVTQGAAGFSKERLEVFGGGATAVIDDFRRLELLRGSRRKVYRDWLGQDKGHRHELAAFVEAARRGGAPPVGIEDYALTTLCTFQAVEALRTGKAQPVSLPLIGGGRENGATLC